MEYQPTVHRRSQDTSPFKMGLSNMKTAAQLQKALQSIADRWSRWYPKIIGKAPNSSAGKDSMLSQRGTQRHLPVDS